MKKRVVFLNLFILSVLLFVQFSCRKSDYSSTGGSNNNTPVAAATIYMKGSVFSISTVNLYANGTVTWTNDDTMVHTVTANDGSFDSGDIQPGASFSHSFTSTGTIGYHCIHHAGMTGTIIVVSH